MMEETNNVDQTAKEKALKINVELPWYILHLYFQPISSNPSHQKGRTSPLGNTYSDAFSGYHTIITILKILCSQSNYNIHLNSHTTAAEISWYVSGNTGTAHED